MHIGLVSQEYPPESAKGGIGTQTFAKAHGLAALGHTVDVISRGANREMTCRRENGVTVTRIHAGPLTAHTEIADWVAYSTQVAAAVQRIHAQNPFDLIDFPEWACEGFVHLSNRTEWNHIPTVIQLHGPLVMFAHAMGWPEIHSEFYRIGTMLEAACLRQADAVFSSSQCSAEWCIEHYHLAPGSIRVIHTGVDIELFFPAPGSRAGRPTIVFAGKLVANKGVDLLVEAACEVAKEFPDLQLQLLGRGETKMIDKLKNMAATKRKPQLLDFPGFVDRRDLPEYFSRSHIFAAPSQYEGGPGFVYLEAMACGLPVIGCSGSGAAEVVRHGETGLLVRPHDLSGLIDALRSLLRDSSKREQMGRAARAFVVAEADSRACLKKLEEFYGAVSARKKEGI